MMHQGMDLSRFKRVSSDKKTTTLRHAKGHEIKIAHSGLSPKMKEQIEALPQHEETVMMAGGGDPISPEEVQAEQAPMPQPAPQPSAPPVAPAPFTPQQQQRAANMGISADQLRQQDALWQQDLMNGHIQPKTYQDLFAKKDTLGKIGTLFGLLVSGAGSGMTGQPNAVMEMMNKEIANDLEAQKQSKTNARSFLELNRQMNMDQANIAKMQQEGLLNEAQAHSLMTDANTKAYALSRMQMNGAALHKLVEQVNMLPVGSPQRQQAEQQLALLSQGIQGENFNIADRAAAAGALSSLAFGQGQGSNDPEAAFQQGNTALRVSGNAPLAQDRESKHMPGVEGAASRPLTAEDTATITSGITFQKKLQEMKDFVDAHKGVEKLDLKDRAKGEAMAAELQNAYRGAINGGVYKPSEQDFIGKIISSTPTKFFDEIRVKPGLEVVQHNSRTDLDQFVKSKGFKGISSVKDLPKGNGPAEGTKGTFKGKPVVFKGGKWTYASK